MDLRRSTLSLALLVVGGGCAVTHSRTIHLVRALPTVVEPDVAAGVLMPVHDLASEATLAGDAPEGNAFGVRATDQFETDAPRLDVVGTMLRDASARASLPLATHAAAGAPWDAGDLAAGEFVLDVSLRTFEVKNRIASLGFVSFPRGGDASVALDWQLFEPGNSTAVARGSAQGSGEASDPAVALFQAVKAASDSLFASAPLRSGISQLQQRAQQKLDAQIDSLRAAGDVSGELLALAAAYRSTADHARADMLFDRIAELVQKLPKRPPISEDGRRLAVEAQSVAEQRNYPRAIDLYLAAERLAPWWPEGFYNAAVLAGDQGMTGIAIDAMQHFVKLMAGTSEARKAQDMIYRWQSAPPSPR